MDKKELNSMTLEELKEFFIDIGEKAFRGEQLFTYFNRNQKLNIEDLAQYSLALRERVLEKGYVNEIKILKRFDSKVDATNKYLMSLKDGNIIETVLMKYKHGNTICLSTQVGCRMGCAFCASTKEGLVRNLSPAEMLNQIYMVEKDSGQAISNIVLMGSGEPLDNYDNVLKFLNIIHHEKGHHISYRNITLSTCGVVPKIYDLAKENIPITLSISLHSPFDDERKKIMPIGKVYNIDEIMKACKFYEDTTSRRLTFEYTLIDGVNDGEREADELGRLLSSLNSHVNLIPLNPIKEYGKERSKQNNIEKFQKSLLNRGINATIRKEMGGDISASCGQLRRSYLE